MFDCFNGRLALFLYSLKTSVPIAIIIFPTYLSILKFVFEEFGKGVCKSFCKGPDGVCHYTLSERVALDLRDALGSIWL